MNDERFWNKVEVGPEADCWPWLGVTNGQGYGIVTRGQKRYVASRMAFTLAVGPIPEGMSVCHRCDNPICCNPAHLFAGTHTDNIRDARDKGRLRMPNAGMTACSKGHPFDATNTYWHRGKRHCRTCKVERQRTARRLAAGEAPDA